MNVSSQPVLTSPDRKNAKKAIVFSSHFLSTRPGLSTCVGDRGTETKGCLITRHAKGLEELGLDALNCSCCFCRRSAHPSRRYDAVIHDARRACLSIYIDMSSVRWDKPDRDLSFPRGRQIGHESHKPLLSRRAQRDSPLQPRAVCNAVRRKNVAYVRPMPACLHDWATPRMPYNNHEPFLSPAVPVQHKLTEPAFSTLSDMPTAGGRTTPRLHWPAAGM